MFMLKPIKVFFIIIKTSQWLLLTLQSSTQRHDLRQVFFLSTGAAEPPGVRLPPAVRVTTEQCRCIEYTHSI